MKRFVTLMIVFAMLFAAVPAFADVTTSKAGEFPITSEKVTFDVWIEGGSDTDWSNNGWLKETEEITNIAINVIPSSSADALNKRNLLLASGDYPDMFLTDWTAIFSQADVMQFGVKEEIPRGVWQGNQLHLRLQPHIQAHIHRAQRRDLRRGPLLRVLSLLRVSQDVYASGLAGQAEPADAHHHRGTARSA